MRRSLARMAALAALALAATTATTAPVIADDSVPTPQPPAGITDGTASLAQLAQEATSQAPSQSTQAASNALDAAQAALSGDAPARGTSQDATQGADQAPDVSMALRDLALQLPNMSASDRRTAQAILARPTDGSSDPYGDGYTTNKRKRKCAGNFCVHWVTDTADAAKRAWAIKTLKTMNSVWHVEVGKMGYRHPVSDRILSGNNGGNGKFDVYLKDLGSAGYYGYCAAEFAKVKSGKTTRQGGGFCVLDNNFSKAEYGQRPVNSLKVTAAHEFFHAVQYAYDYTEDRWFMESTATWMEERYADGVNDNRQYLPSGSVKAPSTALDYFASGSSRPYGNWAWWEFLTHKFNNGIVKTTWNKAAGPSYSTKALKSTLSSKGGFVRNFASYNAANLTPKRTYPEGGSWPSANHGGWTLTGTSTGNNVTATLPHMSAASYVITPGDGVGNKKWRLKIKVDGPVAKTSPIAYVVVRMKNGAWKRSPMNLNAQGNGVKKVLFSGNAVSAVSVTLVNGSTRFKNCGQGTGSVEYSCDGTPVDNGKAFKLVTRAYKN
ncbi:MXAN_6640 family putative metalloprotease [Nocardioides acrostichi]|uniref:Uncharacterized protein n=1 Tax=Nocardioides acrostichi TaxID=2784339 RepID=A0A930UU29_9ACTN|nr:MXAN_6640 family putative metalloprotease [Nocardioides acrostichi]MBF4160858.1 hypothetical protein [Nocardioides acrostichi]